jgi:hypothetical protein
MTHGTVSVSGQVAAPIPLLNPGEIAELVVLERKVQPPNGKLVISADGAIGPDGVWRACVGGSFVPTGLSRWAMRRLMMTAR